MKYVSFFYVITLLLCCKMLPFLFSYDGLPCRRTPCPVWRGPCWLRSVVTVFFGQNSYVTPHFFVKQLWSLNSFSGRSSRGPALRKPNQTDQKPQMTMTWLRVWCERSRVSECVSSSLVSPVFGVKSPRNKCDTADIFNLIYFQKGKGEITLSFFFGLKTG